LPLIYGEQEEEKEGDTLEEKNDQLISHESEEKEIAL
jgi:hypothetical protein